MPASKFSLITSLLSARHRRRKATSPPQKSAMEVLEDRALLAGNVLAKINRGGDLILTGDNLDNHIDIKLSPIGPGIRVQGLADRNGGITTINGQLHIDFVGLPFVQDDLKANMNGGNDRVDVFIGVNGDVNAKMGSGGDYFEIGANVGERLLINTGSASGSLDAVFVTGTTVSGAATIKGGSGGQIVGIDDSTFLTSLSVNTGSGDDALGIGNGDPVIVFGALKLNGGSGDDYFETPGANAPSKNFETIV
ncbi:MAG: hypothetical protein AB8G99_22165 [Planctomycetaceae bacterium]